MRVLTYQTCDISLITTISAALGFGLIFGLMAMRLKLPALVGYLAAGIFLGPATPGIVAEDLSVETMGERLAEIRAEDGYEVPTSMNEEMGIAIKAMS